MVPLLRAEDISEYEADVLSGSTSHPLSSKREKYNKFSTNLLFYKNIRNLPEALPVDTITSI